MKSETTTQSKSRRNFLSKLAFGSVSGLIVGASATAIAEDKKDKKDETPIILQDPNTCRGLNTCKGKGKGGENACAGQGACATAEAHSCKGENACKGQGGCGSTAGQNECKGKGECAVPLKEKAWEKARAAFEKAAKKADMKVGAAPAA